MNQEYRLQDPETRRVFPPLGKRIKALMVWPKIPDSFWTFTGMMEFLPEKAVMPPLGLITVAALCPKEWDIRLIDQAIELLTDADILWADLVMVSAMRVQREGLEEVLSRARSLGRRTIVGGPAWQARNCQHPAQQPGLVDIIKIVLRSIWHQGISSSYRRSYWKYFFRVATRCPRNPAKLWMGFIILISGHHFIPCAKELVQRVESEVLKINDEASGQGESTIPGMEKLGRQDLGRL